MPSKTTASTKLLNTPSAIWETVTKAGGLDLKYHADMDEDIVRSLLRALGAHGSATVAHALRDPSLTVERFVGALLEALNPFATMLSDLLSLFERAGATRTDHSLQIDFDFGNASKLSFDLRQFRDWMESVQRVRELVNVRTWSYRDLWDLERVLQVNDNLKLITPARAWTFEYFERRRWPEFDLPRPTSGDAPLDGALLKAFGVWSMVVRESSKFGRDRREFHERMSGIEESREVGERNWSLRFLAQVDYHNWAGSVATGIHSTAAMAASLPEADRRGFVAAQVEAIEALFARLPTMNIEEESIRRTLVEFLNLPIWQRRHELYSAWVMTLIADAISDRELRFHHDDGLLSFSFSGSHLATAEATMPHLHVWAELRSPLAEQSALSGRKNIQPDYTLVTDPVTSPNSAVVVVECKQYRRFSKKNFSHAVIDYAHGRPNAAIVLAAYGPVRQDFLDSLSPDVAARITLVGHLRPGDTEAQQTFRETVRAALDRRFPPLAGVSGGPRIPTARSEAQTLKSVTLSWKKAPRDLDLHLAVWFAGAWAGVDFRAKGSTSAFPWAELDHDLTEGFGPETIAIAKLLDATYRCYVHNYSDDTPLASSGAEVIITQRDSEIRTSCPRAGAGRFWHVFDFDVASERLTVVNALTLADPTVIAEAEPEC